MRCKLYRLLGFVRGKLKNRKTRWSWYDIYGHKSYLRHVSLKDGALVTIEKCIRCGHELRVEDHDSGKFLKGDKGTR